MDKQLVCMYTIADRAQKDALVAELTAGGAALIDIVFGKGYYEQSMFQLLGFSEQKGKVIVSCLVTRGKSTALLELLNNKYSFSKPGTGIAFTVPVEKIVY